jgi:citronellol/citronellal dehydrogenase
MKLRGKVAIVTGSSRGLGKAIAIGFSKEGANVVITARTEAEKKDMPGTIYQTADEIKALGFENVPFSLQLRMPQVSQEAWRPMRN